MGKISKRASVCLSLGLAFLAMSISTGCAADHPPVSAQLFMRDQVLDVAFDERGRLAIWTDVSLNSQIRIQRNGRCFTPISPDVAETFSDEFQFIIRHASNRSINQVPATQRWYPPCQAGEQMSFFSPIHRESRRDRHSRIERNPTTREQLTPDNQNQLWLSYVTDIGEYRRLASNLPSGDVHRFGERCTIVVDRYQSVANSGGSATHLAVTALIGEVHGQRTEPLRFRSTTLTQENSDSRLLPSIEGARCVERAFAFSFGAHRVATASDAQLQLWFPGSQSASRDGRRHVMHTSLQRLISLLRYSLFQLSAADRQAKANGVALDRDYVSTRTEILRFREAQSQAHCDDYTQLARQNNQRIASSDFYHQGERIQLIADCGDDT